MSQLAPCLVHGFACFVSGAEAEEAACLKKLEEERVVLLFTRKAIDSPHPRPERAARDPELDEVLKWHESRSPQEVCMLLHISSLVFAYHFLL